ncbi:unnamed protein product [Angiostrongylus costaricensis]|uniref:Ubiquitin-like domain-containing protein n=1 Tax=Angiostrongylus costaricensis TaxID=334426 RepID=A0A0R3PL60_ANGCS|nr:unnamed protein product [Angiostrongylus costaricensis]
MASIENLPTNTVELTVRCAFQASKDIKVLCPLHWTIRMLKEHLHQAVTSQRLIFSGACLTDDMIIKDVIDQRWYEYQSFMMSQMGYAAPLGQQIGTGGNNRQTMNIPIARVLTARDGHAGVVPPNQADANVVQAAQQIPAEANVAAAAAVPGGRRDVLDLVYRAFRVLLFLSAVLLYSSVERFLAVITIALFIFFIQLRRNQERQARVSGPAEPNVNNNNAGEQSHGAAEEVQPAYIAPTPPTGFQIFFATCYSFITSFFTSLVPDHPVPIDLN